MPAFHVVAALIFGESITGELPTARELKWVREPARHGYATYTGTKKQSLDSGRWTRSRVTCTEKLNLESLKIVKGVQSKIRLVKSCTLC